jgi:outer membrane protein OmpA-like peptidoglycan-associated protein
VGPNVNTFNREKFPYVDSLGNFYFSSDGYQGLGGMDICIALLKDGIYQTAKPMKYPINTSNDDYGILFTEYNRSGYISSNRPEASVGDADIFYFSFDSDNLSEKIHASDYTIGYKKITKQEVAPTPTPVAVVEPKVVQPAPIFKRDVLNMHFVYFDFDKSNLSKKSTDYLDSVVNYMNENQKLSLLMTGHCDERGSDVYNMKLSERRVKNTATYLTKKGIAKKRITTEAYGLKIMVNKCEGGVICTEEEHQMNRRVEFYFE